MARDALQPPLRGRPASRAYAAGRRGTVERTLSRVSVAVMSFFICAAAFHGFFSKWEFRDSSPYYAVKFAFDGDILRPWAYRRLGPDLANAVDRALPADAHDAIAARLRNRNGQLFLSNLPPLANDDRYIVRYHLLFLGAFAATLLLLFALYRLAREIGAAPLPAYVAAAAGVLIYPTLQTRGGYYYDFPEALFMATFLLLAARRRVIAMLALAVLATWNKESFLFFVPAAFPFLRQQLSVKRSAAVLAGCGALAALVYGTQIVRFQGNIGSPAAWHLFEQLRYVGTLAFLPRVEMIYGMIAPQASSLVMLAAFAGVALPGWRLVDPVVRQHLLIAAAINVPLFVLFCAPGEMRNLSMLFPGFVLLIAASVHAFSNGRILHFVEDRADG